MIRSGIDFINTRIYRSALWVLEYGYTNAFNLKFFEVLLKKWMLPYYKKQYASYSKEKNFPCMLCGDLYVLAACYVVYRSVRTGCNSCGIAYCCFINLIWQPLLCSSSSCAGYLTPTVIDWGFSSHVKIVVQCSFVRLSSIYYPCTRYYDRSQDAEKRSVRGLTHTCTASLPLRCH